MRDRECPGPSSLSTQGCRQVVRQGTLTPSSAGSSPAIPAKHFRMAPHPVIYYTYAPLAQSVEHLPFKQGVWGSNPQRGTKKDATRSGGVFFDAPLSKRPMAFLDKWISLRTARFTRRGRAKHTLARHQPSGLPRPVPLGQGLLRAKCFLRRTRRRKKRLTSYSRRCGAANSVRLFAVGSARIG